MNGIPLRLLATGLAVAVAAVACTGSGASSSANASPSASGSASASASPVASASMQATAETSMTKAADLRVALNLLLLDHVYLTGAATNQALLGNDAGFTAAAATLDKNTLGLGDAIGSAYGDAAKTTFVDIWRKHIGFFVEYTQAAAKNDTAGKQKATAQLDGYRADFDAFLTGANPNLPKGAVAELLVSHVTGLEAMIDAQAAKDPAWSDKAKTAATHSQKIADALAAAIAKQFPDKFTGDPMAKAAGLRTTMNLLLDEHVHLTSYATGAATGGNDAAFTAAAKTLDTNTVALGDAIGSVYADSGRTTFLDLWRKHIGFFVAYTQGAVKNDMAAKQKATTDLDGYRKDFDTFITGANPNLPKGTVADLLGKHVTGLESVIDSQATKDNKSFDLAETTANHSQTIADPLTEAIVKQFPAKFAG